MVSRLLGFLILLLGLSIPAHAQRISPWTEAIVSVRDLEQAARLFIDYGDCRIELMQFVGFEGRDFSKEAQLPNLGTISVRYPVDNLKSYKEQLVKRSVAVAYESANVMINGIGEANLFAVRDPDGNLTEFYKTFAEGVKK